MSDAPQATAMAAAIACLASGPLCAQYDPGVRAGFENTAGELQRIGIPIPHPPLTSPNPTNGAAVQVNEQAIFIRNFDAMLRADQQAILDFLRSL